jgi:hypothetical protein
MGDEHDRDDNDREEIPSDLAQYLAQSVVSTLPVEVYEELKRLNREELKALARLGQALRQGKCEPHHYTYVIH